LRVALVVVPYHLGHEGIGMGAGPDALVEAGLADALESDGHEVELVRVGRDGRSTNEVAASFEVLRAVAERVGEAAATGAFPLALAGNCMTSIGVVAGLDRDVGVVWLDAHADFNTPETTTSGFADGMGLSILTGTGWGAMRATVPGYRPVAEANVALVGIRDVDPAEKERLERSPVAVIEPQDVGAAGTVVDRLRARVSDVYFHLDLDALDPSEGRANAFAVDGGLRADDVELVVRRIAERLRIRAASVTAYDPAADAGARIPPTALRLARSIVACAHVAEEVGAR
jgi:arginase